MINNNLTEFNTGGSHEENKYNGIPQGQSSNGQMNTVEQGETKKGNFVYSDRLYINEDLAKAMNLPGYIKGKSFAGASKAINDKFKDRNDIHTKATQKELLDRLAQSQEQLKAEQEAINQSMQINQSEVEYPESTEQFAGGGLMGMNFSTQDSIMNPNAGGFAGGGESMSDKANSSSNMGTYGQMAGQLGEMIGKDGSYGKSMQTAYGAGFNDTKLQKDQKNEQMLGKTKDTISSALGPFGALFRGIQKAGKGLGDSIGGEGGAAVSGAFSPEEATMSNMTNKDMNVGQKILGTVPGLGAVMAKNSADKRLREHNDTKARVDNFYKYQFNENDNDTQVFALGGEIDPPIKPNYTPTKKDSLNVLNRSIENEKAYLDKGYKMTNSYPVKPDLYDNMLKKSNQIADKQKRNQPTNLIQNGVVTPSVLDVNKYRKDLGNGTFENREIADNYLNMDIKPSLFHQNINPITQKVFTSPDGKDIVNIPSYNSPEFTNSLNKVPVQAQVPVTPSIVTPAVSQTNTPVTSSKKLPVKKDVIPVTDTLQRQNYGVSEMQKFKTNKLAKKELLPSNKTQSNFDSFMKEKTNQKAYGGNLDGKNPWDLPQSTMYDDPNYVNPLFDRKPQVPEVGSNIDYNTMQYKSPVSNQYGTYDNSNNFPNGIYSAPNQEIISEDDKNKKKPFDFKQVSDKFGNALRYAPILGNVLQKANIGPAEVESAIKNPYQYKKQYIDEAAYRNAADQQSALTMEALNKSGLSGNQLMAASLGSQLERTKGVAEGAMAAKMHNLNENKIAEQVKLQNEGDFITDSRYVRGTNAQNRANRDTQMSKFDSEIYNSLGDIGKEELFKKQAEKLTGYKMMGEYMMADPNYKSQYDAIQKDSKLTSKEKYAKEQKLIQEYYKGFDSKAQEQVSNSIKETATAGHAYGGYMSPKFKKY